MKYCKSKFIRKFAAVLSLMLLLNSVLFVNNAMAQHEAEKMKSNEVIKLFGKEMHICSSKGTKTVTINEYIDLFNAKHFNDAGKDPSLKKAPDSYLGSTKPAPTLYSVSQKTYQPVGEVIFTENSFYSVSPRSPPVAA
jgi:hypothetical protein